MTKLIQVSEAARRLGVHRQTLENWGSRGIINIRKDKNAHWVDEELIGKIGDLGTDVEKTLNELRELKNQYHRELADYERLRTDLQVEHRCLDDERRYLNLCVQGSLRSQFFQVILGLMEIYGNIDHRENMILQMCLEGIGIGEISEKFGVKRERIRQIAEKAIRKCRNLSSFSELSDKVREYEADISGLKAIIKDLQDKLDKQETAKRVEKEKELIEKKKEFLENDHLCKLFNTNLIDCELSVRVLNCLKNGGAEYNLSCKTIGDLCKLSRTDFLKLRNAGHKSLNEVSVFLERLGLSWGMDVDTIYKQRIEALMNLEETNEDMTDETDKRSI